MSSKKKRSKTKLKSIPTLEFLKFKTFNMIDGEFKGGNVYLTHRNPHGRWSIQYHIRYGSGVNIRSKNGILTFNIPFMFLYKL